MPENQRINLVTGSNGYIGSYVANRLPNVYRVKREEFDDPRLKGDHLICLHGAASLSPFLLQSEESERRIWDANYFSVTRIVRNVARHMVAQRYGKIILCSSTVTLEALPGEATYGASKAALDYFTEVLNLELGPHGVTVTAISPGPVTGSPMMRGVKTKLPFTTLEAIWNSISALLKN